MIPEAEKWFQSGKFAQLNGRQFKPKEHPKLKGSPLAFERGQAVALFLEADDGCEWVLKKFSQGRCPDSMYLRQISAVLPAHAGFMAGKQRRVLSASDLKGVGCCYYSAELKDWISETVLMPRVPGQSWHVLADRIREGDVGITNDARLVLCRGLSELVQLLEGSGCSHRDLSGANVFIEPTTGRIWLIDFDCLYHPNFALPAATTCGTNGYVAPFVCKGGIPECRMTWCPLADRFALAVLIVEILVMARGAPLAGDGGLFEQSDLCTRTSRSLRRAFAALERNWPAAVPMFERAITAGSYADCPSPHDWLSSCESALWGFEVPALASLGDSDSDLIQRVLQRRRHVTPAWPAPRLDELPEPALVRPRQSVALVPNNNGNNGNGFGSLGCPSNHSPPTRSALKRLCAWFSNPNGGPRP